MKAPLLSGSSSCHCPLCLTGKNLRLLNSKSKYLRSQTVKEKIIQTLSEAVRRTLFQTVAVGQKEWAPLHTVRADGRVVAKERMRSRCWKIIQRRPHGWGDSW